MFRLLLVCHNVNISFAQPETKIIKYQNYINMCKCMALWQSKSKTESKNVKSCHCTHERRNSTKLIQSIWI